MSEALAMFYLGQSKTKR